MENNFEELRLCITSAIAKTGRYRVNKEIKQQLGILQGYVGSYYYNDLTNNLFLYLASPRDGEPSRYAMWDKDKSSLQVYVNMVVLNYLKNFNVKMQEMMKKRTKPEEFFTEEPLPITARVKIGGSYKTRPIEIEVSEVGEVDITDYDYYRNKLSPEASLIVKDVQDNADAEERVLLEVIYRHITKKEAAAELGIHINTLYRKFNKFNEKIQK